MREPSPEINIVDESVIYIDHDSVPGEVWTALIDIALTAAERAG